MIQNSCTSFFSDYGIKIQSHLFVDLRGGLGVTEGDCGDVLEYWHLHRAVPTVKERHQRPRVHWAIWDGATNRAGLNSGSFSWLHHIDFPLIHQTETMIC